MTNPPKASGYIDAEALHRAVEANRRLVELTEMLIADVDGMSRLRRSILLQQFGLSLAQQRDALATMEEIRQRRRGNV